MNFCYTQVYFYTHEVCTESSVNTISRDLSIFHNSSEVLICYISGMVILHMSMAFILGWLEKKCPILE